MNISKLPSIRNRALLMSLEFHKPQMSKQDKKATKDVVDKNNASAAAFRVQKQLYPKEYIDPIIACESKAREVLRVNGIEWAGGLYLVDTRRFLQVREQITKICDIERKQAITAFAQNWSNVLLRAQQDQGSLFDAMTYPDLSQVLAEFTYAVKVLPLGDLAPDMFTSIEEDLAEAVREQVTDDVERTTRESLIKTITTPVSRLLEAVLNIYDKTSREGSRIHDALLTDLESIIELIPSFNVLEIPHLQSLADACHARLTIHPADMRDKKTGERVRAKVAEDAKKILTVAGVKPTDLIDVQDPQKRKEIAENAAADILKKMEGFL